MPLGRIGFLFCVVVVYSSSGQAYAQTQVSARIDAQPIYATKPERYWLPLPLEPARKITMVATNDGILRSIAVALGANVRENAEVLQVDRTEAQAKLKIAEAIVKERTAELDEAKKNNANTAIPEAKLEAAKGEVDLARLVLDHCTYRAPFAGKITSAPWSPGQMLLKGAVLAELADVSNLRVMVPVDRTSVQVGSQIKLMVEGKSANGKVEAILPLSETFSVLRELAAPYSAAWVSIPNPRGEFEPGFRAQFSLSAGVADHQRSFQIRTRHQRRRGQGCSSDPQRIRHEHPSQGLGSGWNRVHAGLWSFPGQRSVDRRIEPAFGRRSFRPIWRSRSRRSGAGSQSTRRHGRRDRPSGIDGDRTHWSGGHRLFEGS